MISNDLSMRRFEWERASVHFESSKKECKKSPKCYKTNPSNLGENSNEM